VILTICYAAGLRISEAIRLKASTIDSRRMVIRVEQGKGRKDRYVMLSPKLLDILRGYWKVVHPKNWLFPGSHTTGRSRRMPSKQPARQHIACPAFPSRSHRIR
jgi:integrase